MQPVCLIACCKTKAARAAPARELYQSDLFRKAVQYAESLGLRWYVLSAKHGLLSPLAQVEPYEQSLNTMDSADRDDWGHAVAKQILREIHPSAPLIILAGKQYRRWIEIAFKDRAVVPMKGLGMGRSKQWLRDHLGQMPALPVAEEAPALEVVGPCVGSGAKTRTFPGKYGHIVEQSACGRYVKFDSKYGPRRMAKWLAARDLDIYALRTPKE